MTKVSVAAAVVVSAMIGVVLAVVALAMAADLVVLAQVAVVIGIVVVHAVAPVALAAHLHGTEIVGHGAMSAMIGQAVQADVLGIAHSVSGRRSRRT